MRMHVECELDTMRMHHGMADFLHERNAIRLLSVCGSDFSNLCRPVVVTIKSGSNVADREGEGV